MKRVARLLPVSLLIVLEIGILYAAWIAVTLPAAQPIPLLGNRPENIAALPYPQAQDPYRFGVIGDTRGNQEIAEWLFDKLKDAGVSFVLHMGDIVPMAEDGEYRYLVAEFPEIQYVPVLVAPGNHDLGQMERWRSQSFDQVLGPRQTYFTFRNDLFIIANNVSQPTGDLVRWLTEVLQREAEGKRYIFLVIHANIFRIKEDHFMVDRGHPIHEVARKWGIDYVFHGNYHSFLSAEVDGVNYIVSGGGGSRLHGKSGFYHAAILGVSDSGIQLILQVSPYATSLRDVFERVVTYVYTLEDLFEWWVIRFLVAFDHEPPYVTWILLAAIQASIIACGIWTARKGSKSRIRMDSEV